jgi:voltage-gated sodium channel
VLVGGILGLSLANAVFVDEMMADNTESLERKVDDLAAELRRIRERLGG